MTDLDPQLLKDPFHDEEEQQRAMDDEDERLVHFWMKVERLRDYAPVKP